jgi:pentapeptide MXKDX repeat protein
MSKILSALLAAAFAVVTVSPAFAADEKKEAKKEMKKEEGKKDEAKKDDAKKDAKKEDKK